MKVKDLIEKLQKMDPEKPIRVHVGWSHDTAMSDEGEETVDEKDDAVHIGGWLSNCGTCLEIEDEE